MNNVEISGFICTILSFCVKMTYNFFNAKGSIYVQEKIWRQKRRQKDSYT